MDKIDKYIPYTEIVHFLQISKGDILYVTSDIRELMITCRNNGEEFKCELFIESLQNAVGMEGTLLFPTFNWNFCIGIPFDYYKTKGKTGSLGNFALEMPCFKRTPHPLYSFAVWGKAQNDLMMLDNKSGFGEGSPFEYMHKNNAKTMTIGLTPGFIKTPQVGRMGNTFKHYVEQMHKVDYRYEKEFTTLYTDANGNTENRTYSMYVRDLDKNPVSKPSGIIYQIMLDLGICKYFEINGVHFHITDLAGMFEVISLELRYNNANNLYTFTKR
jgi:aminoglycoside 3-N-acetyltransferase